MNRATQMTLRALAILIGVPLVAALAIYAVLYFTTWGIPATWTLKFYAPPIAGHAAEDPCVEPRDVVPQSSLSRVLPALEAIDGPAQNGFYATQAARYFACQGSGGNIARSVRELRLAVQIRRRFTPAEQMAMDLNLAYFGENEPGIVTASQHLFGKPVDQLDTARAALLAGMVDRPTFYSPRLHPDHAWSRRNQVLDAMFRNGALSRKAWLHAKAEPLLLVPQISPETRP